MLSRVAENLYWISRYVERAENLARLLGVLFHVELDTGLSSESPGSNPLHQVLTMLACRKAFEQRYASCNRESVLRFLTLDRSGGHSIQAMIARARENARGAQETLSTETWSQLNRLHLFLSSKRARTRYQTSSFWFYDRVKQACILFAGLVDSSLPRMEVFHFLRLGRYLERVDMTSRILQVRFQTQPAQSTPADQPEDLLRLTSLLFSCSAFEAYQKEFRDRIDTVSVVGYLVLDPAFPRTLRFGVTRCLESLRALTEGEATGHALEAERQLGRLESELRYIDVRDIFQRGVSDFLTGVQDACNRIGQEIHQAYFLS
jgi:uncharacterized alpha-E superfamily protein